jgi:hypothetical protein
MKVKDLIAKLQLMYPDAEVVVERNSEYRELHAEDLMDADMMVPLADTDESIDGPILLIRTWR